MIEGLAVGKVVDVHPEHNSVDVRLAKDGRHLVGVPVCGLAISGNTGVVDLPIPDLTTARTDPAKWESFNTDKRDIMAVVAFTEMGPVCLSFVGPPLCELNFDGEIAKERRIARHASDVYEWLDQFGDAQWAHPSGSYISFGEARDFLDLEAKDYDKKWKLRRNLKRRPGMRVVIASGGHSYAELDVDADGNVVLRTDGKVTVTAKGDVAVNTEGNLTASADGRIEASAGDDISVNAGGAVTVESAEAVLLKGDGDVTIESALDVHVRARKLKVHCPLEFQPGAGLSSSTGTLHIAGPAQVDGDLHVTGNISAPNLDH